MSGEIASQDHTPFERFAYRLNLSDPGVTQENFTMSAAEDLAADAVAFHGGLTTYIGSAARLSEVKLARIGADGKYTADPLIVAVSQRGTGAVMDNAPQVALAVSLVTARRGPSGKGRFYLPCPGSRASHEDGMIPLADQATITGAVKTFLDNVNNHAGLDFANSKVVVASSKGYNSDVTAVRVGRVLDTIRSRRRSIPETFVAPTPLA